MIADLIARVERIQENESLKDDHGQSKCQEFQLIQVFGTDRLLQVLSAKDAQRIVQNISGAILPGGSIYIVNQILDDSRISPPSSVGFNLRAINQFEAGVAHTEREYREWLSEAGFVDIERANFTLAGGLGLMTARKQG